MSRSEFFATASYMGNGRRKVLTIRNVYKNEFDNCGLFGKWSRHLTRSLGVLSHPRRHFRRKISSDKWFAYTSTFWFWKWLLLDFGLWNQRLSPEKYCYKWGMFGKWGLFGKILHSTYSITRLMIAMSRLWRCSIGEACTSNRNCTQPCFHIKVLTLSSRWKVME